MERILKKCGVCLLAVIGLVMYCTELRFDNPYETGGNNPVIKLYGATSLKLVINQKYDERGYEASDNDGKDLTGKVKVTVKDKDNTTVSINSFTERIGNYTISYKVTNDNGFSASAKRDVLVVGIVDSIPPVITLKGKNPEEIYQNQQYKDPGASASDNINGDLSSKIVVTIEVDSSVIGSHKVDYYVEDTAGNSDSKTRIVNVLVIPDTTPPVITIIGDDTIKVNYKGFYVDPGASALDDKDGPVPVNEHGLSDINTDSLGKTYVVFYTASDRAGNQADTVFRYVIIADLEAPTIFLLPPINVTLGVGYPYKEYGAYARDNVDDSIPFTEFTVENNVDTSTAGEYTVKYKVSDAAGNQATPVDRIVKVVDKLWIRD